MPAVSALQQFSGVADMAVVICNQIIAMINHILIGADNGGAFGDKFHVWWVKTGIKDCMLLGSIKWVINQQQRENYFWVLLRSEERRVGKECL